jgi:hypothetical protein
VSDKYNQEIADKVLDFMRNHFIACNGEKSLDVLRRIGGVFIVMNQLVNTDPKHVEGLQEESDQLYEAFGKATQGKRLGAIVDAAYRLSAAASGSIATFREEGETKDPSPEIFTRNINLVADLGGSKCPTMEEQAEASGFNLTPPPEEEE